MFHLQLETMRKKMLLDDIKNSPTALEWDAILFSTFMEENLWTPGLFDYLLLCFLLSFFAIAFLLSSPVIIKLLIQHHYLREEM